MKSIKWPSRGTAEGKPGGRFSPGAVRAAAVRARPALQLVRSQVTRNGVTILKAMESGKRHSSAAASIVPRSAMMAVRRSVGEAFDGVSSGSFRTLVARKVLSVGSRRIVLGVGSNADGYHLVLESAEQYGHPLPRSNVLVCCGHLAWQATDVNWMDIVCAGVVLIALRTD